MSCKGNCKTCPGAAVPEIKSGYRPKDKDIQELFEPFEKQKADGSDLESKCIHYPYGVIARYQCEECIQEYVYAVSYEKCLEQADKYKKLGKSVANSRILLYANEREHKRRLNPED